MRFEAEKMSQDQSMIGRNEVLGLAIVLSAVDNWLLFYGLSHSDNIISMNTTTRRFNTPSLPFQLREKLNRLHISEIPRT
jgi:hypothetical protein